jgi:DNA-binding LytR/AlgR family response regulator
VLIAILITGLGLSLMFVGERTLSRTIQAGTLTGLGIVSMHYVGMAAVSGYCLVTYIPAGFFISTAIAILFSICALRLAYGRRTLPQLYFGAVVLGVTIAGMHYSAMAYTRFTQLAEAVPVALPNIQSEYLALIVAVAAFVVCGLFLLTALPLEASAARDTDPGIDSLRSPASAQPVPAEDALAADAASEVKENGPLANASGMRALPERARLPYEQQNTTYFIDADRIHAIKAEGHYTRLYDGAKVYFCPWSISKIETHVAGHSFLRTHRSFLVNIRHAGAFQRKKDKAYLIIPAVKEAMVPVSRFHLAEVRRALGI